MHGGDVSAACEAWIRTAVRSVGISVSVVVSTRQTSATMRPKGHGARDDAATGLSQALTQL